MQYSFHVWGRRRDPADWNNYTGLTAPQYMIRGFTMHEMLDEMGLINMNGRVYDPVVGRFLQPDSYVQDPGNLQNLNRYSYVMNNPLKYNDPHRPSEPETNSTNICTIEKRVNEINKVNKNLKTKKQIV